MYCFFCPGQGRTHAAGLLFDLTTGGGSQLRLDQYSLHVDLCRGSLRLFALLFGLQRRANARDRCNLNLVKSGQHCILVS
jgi:hypothetical protein